MGNMHSRLRQQDGAAAVEFALIVGVLALLIFGMLQFGVAFFQLQNLRAATREGARYGAVGASATQITDRVEEWGRVSGLGAAVVVERQGPVGTYTTATDDEKPCSTVDGGEAVSVRAGIDLSSPSLPAGLQDIFTLNIPLMPPISLQGADVAGEFRCEGAA